MEEVYGESLHVSSTVVTVAISPITKLFDVQQVFVFYKLTKTLSSTDKPPIKLCRLQKQTY